MFSTASWEGRADFSQADVHRQIAIVFKTPPYEDLSIPEPVTVNVFLQRLTDGVCSEPLPFTYLPLDHGNSIPILNLALPPLAFSSSLDFPPASASLP